MSATLEQPETGNVAGSTAWSTIEIDLGDLVLDDKLQCRAKLDPDTVESYRLLLEEGGTFRDRMRCVRVAGELLLVDGWHRHAAYVRASGVSSRILVDVRDGDRRDALLEAVKANSDHGLPRTRDDKRRAVRTLLMDPEWCKGSSHELGRMAQVSHTFVNNLREHYGVKPGEVVTEQMVELLDGEVTGRWAELLKAASYKRSEINAIRTARSIRALAELRRPTGSSPPSLSLIWPSDPDVVEAHVLRLAELGKGGAWPWGLQETPEDRKAFADELDNLAQIELALQAEDCPEPLELFKVYKQRFKLPDNIWQLEQLETVWANRRDFLADVREKLAELRKAETERQADDPYHQARYIVTLDAAAQAQRIKACKKAVLDVVEVKKLDPSVRDGVFRDRVCPDGFLTCPDPSCGGWLRVRQYYTSNLGRCVICDQDGKEWRERTVDGAQRLAKLVQHPDHGIRVRGVVIDVAALDLLDALAAEPERLGSIARNCPPAVKAAMLAWSKRDTPKNLIDADATDDDEEDLDDDDDLDDAGDGAEEE